MSGILKSIGKVFRKIKKFALPVLAIGAIALTGGAALGILPAVGSTIGGLGLGSTVTAALTTAAQGATMGALTSAVTGGNIMKGATTGFGIGAGLGAAGAALGGTAMAAGGAGQAAQAAGDMSGITVGGAAQTAMSSIPAASGVGATAGTAAATGASGGLLGGVGGFINKNPIIAGTLIQGIGSGMMAAQQAKEDQREYDSTLGYSGLGGTAATISDPGHLAYDPSTGKIAKKASS